MPFSGKEGINLVWESEGAWGVVVFDFSDLFVEEILLSLCVNAFLSVLWRRLVGHECLQVTPEKERCVPLFILLSVSLSAH